MVSVNFVPQMLNHEYATWQQTLYVLRLLINLSLKVRYLN